MSKWYEHAIIYQIYPKSFQDTNQDGIGDLNGIRKRISYLKFLGINTVWLNPIFVSPQVDNGYDVSNYFAIDPKMGTMADMTKLIQELHQAGIKLILDFVLNHTSDQHPWFQEASQDAESLYRDYYLFAGHNGKLPNNWGSFFGGSVWQADPTGSGQFYFHLFDKHMPDLNWHNPEVRHAMLDVAKFWLAKGVDGLRLDAFIHIAKADFNQNFPTNTPKEKPVIAEPFFANLPQVQTWLAPFCQQLKEDYPDVFLLGEAASANVNLAVAYTQKRQRLLDSVITFRYFHEQMSGLDPHFSAQYQPKSFDFDAFKQTQAIWQQTLSSVSLPTLYWNNHDLPRLATRLANSETQAKSLAILMYLQRGIPIIYYGEELGMKNLTFSKVTSFQDQTVTQFVHDAIRAGKTISQALQMASQTHKLPARGPMVWDETPYGGFSSSRPWLYSENKPAIASVLKQKASATSLLNFYRALIALKKTPLFQNGRFCLWQTDQNSYVYQRMSGSQKAIVAVSLCAQAVTIQLSASSYQVCLHAGDFDLFSDHLVLQPFASVVLCQKNEF